MHGYAAPLANRVAALYHCRVELFDGDAAPSFYVYIKQGKPWMIHRGSCGFCNDGTGPTADRSKRGRWSEAYGSLEAAEAAWAEIGGSVLRCSASVS